MFLVRFVYVWLCFLRFLVGCVGTGECKVCEFRLCFFIFQWLSPLLKIKSIFSFFRQPKDKLDPWPYRLALEACKGGSKVLIYLPINTSCSLSHNPSARSSAYCFSGEFVEIVVYA